MKRIPLISLVFAILTLLIVACKKEKVQINPDNTLPTSVDVIIIGAGASGLAAAKKLEEDSVTYQILEATNKLGGRIQKNDTFADFPIDIGAEWIHENKSILN